MIQVQAEMDRMGNVIVAPVSRRWRNAFAEHVAAFTGHEPDQEQSVFMPEGMSAGGFIDHDLPRRRRSELLSGWPVVFLAHPWIVGHWYGYDTHTVAEAGV